MKKTAMQTVLFSFFAFLLTFLFSRASLPFSLSPFYSGVFLFSLGIGESFWIACPVFLAATGLAYLSLPALFRSVFAAVGVGAVALICRVKKRRFNGYFASLTSLFASVFTLFFIPIGSFPLFCADLALSSIFSLIASRAAERGRTGAFSYGAVEKLLFLAAFFALGAGAISTRAFGLSPYYLLLSLLLPLLALLGADGVLFSFAFTLGASLSSGNAVLFFPVSIALGVSLLAGEKRIVSCFGVVAAEAVAFFSGAVSFSPYNFALLFSGALFSALFPKDALRKIGVRFGRQEKASARSVVNKARISLSGKLGCMSDALRKLSASLSYDSCSDDASEAARRISSVLSSSLCEGCKGRKDCSRQAGGNTAALFEETVLRAIENGKATICDISPYLNSNCHKIKALLDDLNEGVGALNEESEKSRCLKSEREAMASEVEGIALILDALKKETRRQVTFDSRREKNVTFALAAEGIVAYDPMVTEEGEELSVTVTMSERDAEKKCAAKAVSRAIGVPLLAESVSVLGAGSVSVSFAVAPPFDLIVGEAVSRKEGSVRSGDVKSVTRLGVDKVMVALSDGMGSGEGAFGGATAAIGLVENFYKTGVEEKIVLPLINRLLTIRNDGSFQTLDMCVINLRTGEADFIKLSAPESIVRKKEGCEIVEGGALPLGILREIRPSVTRKRLSPGDTVVLATDGVTDAIGADGIVRVAESCRSNNPQTVADAVLSDASYVSSSDDKTVVALRLFRRLPD